MLTVVGVRHHSPACARHVGAVIDRLRPRHVLIEGPADMNDRLDELLLGHDLPVAIFSSYRDGERMHASWSPFCAYSPEWVALTRGRAVGAQVRFIDLPAWDPAFTATNRYADAEVRYATALERLCARFRVDNADTLWDELFEAADPAGIGERLDAYFDLVRGDAAADPGDAAREAYMASWVGAARDAGDGPVVVVCGGFHRPALLRLVAASPAGSGWPAVPAPTGEAVSASYLVPYSFRRLDAFGGYRSGMPSPGYYQRVWESGVADAARGLAADVVARLRERRQSVSTADLIAARGLTDGLARLRGHPAPSRTDVLDGLTSALVTGALDVPLPWTRRGVLAPATDPVVVEMVAALCGDRVGRLAPGTPLPPLVHDVEAEIERHRLTPGEIVTDLTDRGGRERSRVLHRLRVLGVPGFVRTAGPRTGLDPVLTERWDVEASDLRLPAIVEAGGYGPTLFAAAVAVLAERAAGAAGVDAIGAALFDAALCGAGALGADLLGEVRDRVGGVTDAAALGALLAVLVGLWRNDHLLDTAGDPTLAEVVAAAVPRLLWLLEGVRGGPQPADPGRSAAVAAVRDAVGPGPAGAARSVALAVLGRIAADVDAPPDLRGAALGFTWSLREPPADLPRLVRGAAAPRVLGDWLAGLFAVARDEVLDEPAVLTVLDETLVGMGHDDFLVALPALRQAFELFPPRERHRIAEILLAARGGRSSTADLLRLRVDPVAVAEAAALEERVDVALAEAGLLAEEDPP